MEARLQRGKLASLDYGLKKMCQNIEEEVHLVRGKNISFVERLKTLKRENRLFWEENEGLYYMLNRFPTTCQDSKQKFLWHFLTVILKYFGVASKAMNSIHKGCTSETCDFCLFAEEDVGK